MSLLALGNYLRYSSKRRKSCFYIFRCNFWAEVSDKDMEMVFWEGKQKTKKRDKKGSYHWKMVTGAHARRSNLTEHRFPASIKYYVTAGVYYGTESTAARSRSFAWQRDGVSDFKDTTATHAVYAWYFTNCF